MDTKTTTGIVIGAAGMIAVMIAMGAGEDALFRIPRENHEITAEQFDALAECFQANSGWEGGNLETATATRGDGTPRVVVSYDKSAPADQPPADAIGFSPRVFEELKEAAAVK